MTYNQCYRMILRLRFHLIFTIVSLFVMVVDSYGEVSTVITADGTMGTEVTVREVPIPLPPGVPLPPGDIAVERFYDITEGTPKVGNLFHSFLQFDVAAGETAKFANVPGDIINILSRVSGNDPSNIYGRIQIEQTSSANLYFFNPKGVVFGPNSTLDIKGSFYVSTADYLGLDDGVKFNAIPGPTDALLTSAPVKSFGFLSGNPTSISLNQDRFNVKDKMTLSVIGGDININGPVLSAPSGRINIASAASSGEVVLGENGIHMKGFRNQGSITMTGSSQINVVASTTKSNEGENSAVYIRGGKFLIRDSKIFANNRKKASKGIGIQLTGDFESTNTSIRSRPLGSAKGGGIVIEADNIQLNGTEITAQSFSDQNAGNTVAFGSSGDIELAASGEVNMSGLSRIDTSTQGAENTGNAGNIEITAGSIVVDNSSSISSKSESIGSAGNIEIMADSIEVKNSAKILSSTGGLSNQGAGEVTLKSDKNLKLNLTLNSGGQINSSTAGGGKGGLITVNAESVAIDGDNSSISAETSGVGDGGNVQLNVSNMILTDSGKISTSALESSAGNAGDITATSESVSVSGARSAISSSAQGKGNAGAVELKEVKSLALSKGGVISTDSKGEGSGGNITVMSDSISLSGPSASISSRSEGLKDAGSITINANNIVMNNKSSITTDATKADGGNINLNVNSLMHLIDSDITSSVKGGPDTEGGNITMTQQYAVLQKSKIVANAFEGKGGNIQITAEVFMEDPNSVLSASSKKGISGEVDIRATVKNISGSIGQLKEDYSSADSLLLESCVVRMSDGKKSSLIVAGRDGLPARPGDLMPSPVYDRDMARADAAVAGIWANEPLAYGDNFFEKKGLLPLDMLETDTGCANCP